MLTSILHICAPEDLINSAVSDITTLQSLVKFAEELKIKASGENKDIERQEEEEEEAALQKEYDESRTAWEELKESGGCMKCYEMQEARKRL